MSSTSPFPGAWRDGQSKGSHNSSANGLPGTPRGNSIQNAATSASGSAYQRASGSHHNARPLSCSHVKPGQLHPKAVAAQCHAQVPAPGCSDSSPVPNSASGTTTRLHQGTATRFASGPDNDACPNSTTVNGSNPRVATACALASPCNGLRSLPGGRHHSSQATPPKLSQKPGVSSARGSTSPTAIAASPSASAIPCPRRASRAATITPIISAVRTVGSAKPATAA